MLDNHIIGGCSAYIIPYIYCLAMVLGFATARLLLPRSNTSAALALSVANLCGFPLSAIFYAKIGIVLSASPAIGLAGWALIMGNLLMMWVVCIRFLINMAWAHGHDAGNSQAGKSQHAPKLASNLFIQSALSCALFILAPSLGAAVLIISL